MNIIHVILCSTKLTRSDHVNLDSTGEQPPYSSSYFQFKITSETKNLQHSKRAHRKHTKMASAFHHLMLLA